MNCRHNWIPSNFGIKYRTPNHYIFECTRCGKSIFATLKEPNEPRPHHQSTVRTTKP